MSLTTRKAGPAAVKFHFGERWPRVQRVLAEFRHMGVHLLDVSPGNISFRE
jgi:hypothetical protein